MSNVIDEWACGMDDIWIVAVLGLNVLWYSGFRPLGNGILKGPLWEVIKLGLGGFYGYAAYKKWIAKDCLPTNL
jgi:hypothetical protein